MTGVVEYFRRTAAEWLLPGVVFAAVVAVQLWLVAVAGTDIPFQDQWNIEGGWLYPAWQDGSLHAPDLVQPFNEHRILWTHLLNLGLFIANGRWDPLVQLAAIAVLRGTCAAGLAWIMGAALTKRGRIAVAAGVVFAFLPHLPWHNVLWGMESQCVFVLGSSLLSLSLLGQAPRSPGRTCMGLVAGGAALLAMGPGALVPVALLGMAVLGIVESRRVDRTVWLQTWPALVLLGAALVLRVSAPQHAGLEAATWSRFASALGQILGWPHGGQPLAALPLNLPLLLVVSGRVLRVRRPAGGEDFILLMAGWSLGVALATAWVRGGSDELAVGVPSRYVDFVVLLPLANAWCVIRLLHEIRSQWRRAAQLVAGAWGIFLFVGWLGLSTQVMRGLVLPRVRDRDAPVRLMQEFQRDGNAGVFVGQPRLYVPHPDLGAVRQVLQDPRMQHALPPSLQPEQPMGPLSRGVRCLLGR